MTPTEWLIAGLLIGLYLFSWFVTRTMIHLLEYTGMVYDGLEKVRERIDSLERANLFDEDIPESPRWDTRGLPTRLGDELAETIEEITEDIDG